MCFEIVSAGLGSAVPSKSLLGWAASAVHEPCWCDFWSQVAPTWMPGPAIIAIPRERGIEMHKSHGSDKTVKNRACGPQVEAQIVPKLVKGVPSSPHRASKCSQMQPWAVKLVYFSIHLARFEPSIAQGWFRCSILSSKRTSRHPKQSKCIHFHSESLTSGSE